MLKDIAPKGQAKTVKQARTLRRDMSLPEVLVWRELRRAPNGIKFRRQHATGPYTLDFYCSDARLAVEIDGAGHRAGDRPVRDEARDAWLRGNGIFTLHIPARDVLADLSASVEQIVLTAASRMPLHHPATPGGPPPRDKLGED